MTRHKAAKLSTGKPGAPAGRTQADGEPCNVAIGSKPAPSTKQGRLVAMLVSDAGTTLAAMVAATGWQSHTVRAALTGLRKRDYAISSDKLDGVRTYRAVAPE